MALPRMIGPTDVFKCYMRKLNELTAILERALVDFSARNGNVIQPVRSAVQVPDHNGLLLTMPAFSKTEDALVTKLVTVYPDNAARQLPVVQSSVLIFSSKTGSLNSMVDGGVLTALRTAHVSAIATKHLSSRFEILTVLGAGTQAKSHIQIFAAMFKFKEIRIWNHHIEGAKRLVAELDSIRIPMTVFQSAEEAVRNTDVIVTATISKVPVLMSDWVMPGTHINAVGACDSYSQELETMLMTSASVYVDSKEAALIESGDIIASKAEITAELGEVILQNTEPKPGVTTIFKSLGMAIEDAVTAKFIYQSFSETD